MDFVFATTMAGVIGSQNGLPWGKPFPEDMKWFRTVTKERVLVMGRKTWESIGSKSLPNRPSIVVSRNKVDGADITITNWYDQDSLASQIYQASKLLGDDTPCVIGGKKLFDTLLPYAKTLYITTVYHDYPGDTQLMISNYMADTVIEDFSHISATPSTPALSFGVYRKAANKSLEIVNATVS